MSASSIQRLRGLNILTKKHKSVKKILKKGNYPEIHGDKVWFSSYFIMDYLRERKLGNKANIMEIGSGWGILSVYCAKKLKAKVVGVDADPNVMPFLKLHARKNGVKVTTKVSRYEHLKPKLLAQQDLIVGADICFWDEMTEPLFKLIKRALKQKVKRIIIADPGRPPFLKLAKRCKKKFGAKLIPVGIKKPKEHYGYLLVIKR